MSSRIGLCSVGGGIALLIWGAFSWMVLPFNGLNLNSFTDEDTVASVLTENTTGHGVFVYPGPGDMSEQGTQKLAKGPFAFVIFRPGATIPMGTLMLRGLLINVIAAGLVANLLARSTCRTLAGRVLFCVLVCMTGGVLIRLSDWNWWYFPTGYVLQELFNMLVSGLLLGLVIGKLLGPVDDTAKPQPDASH